jgi:hypothetical protein
MFFVFLASIAVLLDFSKRMGTPSWVGFRHICIKFFGDDVFESFRSDRSASGLFEHQQKVLYENCWA